MIVFIKKSRILFLAFLGLAAEGLVGPSVMVSQVHAASEGATTTNATANTALTGDKVGDTGKVNNANEVLCKVAASVISAKESLKKRQFYDAFNDSMELLKKGAKNLGGMEKDATLQTYADLFVTMRGYAARFQETLNAVNKKGAHTRGTRWDVLYKSALYKDTDQLNEIAKKVIEKPKEIIEGIEDLIKPPEDSKVSLPAAVGTFLGFLGKVKGHLSNLSTAFAIAEQVMKWTERGVKQNFFNSLNNNLLGFSETYKKFLSSETLLTKSIIDPYLKAKIALSSQNQQVEGLVQPIKGIPLKQACPELKERIENLEQVFHDVFKSTNESELARMQILIMQEYDRTSPAERGKFEQMQQELEGYRKKREIYEVLRQSFFDKINFATTEREKKVV